MALRIQLDPKEFIKFVKENNKLDPYELGKKYNMSQSSMTRCLSKYGFIRIRTSEGMRYVLESEIIPSKKNEEKPAQSSGPKVPYAYDPKESYEDVIEYNFHSKEPIDKLRMDVNMKMIALGSRLKELNKEIEKKGYSENISQDKTEKITIELPTGFITTLNSARLTTASNLADKKPIEEWTVNDCMRFMTMENWIITSAYKYAIGMLLKESDPDKLKVVPCAEGYKKYSKHPAHG